jgi:hypothetical protein
MLIILISLVLPVIVAADEKYCVIDRELDA